MSVFSVGVESPATAATNMEEAEVRRWFGVGAIGFGRQRLIQDIYSPVYIPFFHKNILIINIQPACLCVVSVFIPI